MFTVIGLLDEYGPREIAKSKAEVECFYPKETSVADLFETYLHRLVNEYNLQTEIRRERSESGHIYFYSKELNDLICSFYVEKGLTDLGSNEIPEFTDEKGYAHYFRGRIGDATFPPLTHPSRLTPEQHDARLAYLIGAYARNGKDNYFRFGNSLHKARVVENLLIDLGCNWLRFTRDMRGVPTLNEIEFKMTEEMKHNFVSYRSS